MTRRVNWKRVLILYLIGGLVLLGIWFALRSLSASVSGTSNGPKPQLIITETIQEFGRVKAGTLLEHEFEVHNQGTARAVLNHKFCGSCGDPQTEQPTVILSPGESMRVPVTIATTGHSGPLQETVALTTSDDNHPYIEFTVTAHVID